MKENKTHQLVINVEETVYHKFVALANKSQLSASALGRKLILQHMVETEAISKEQLLDIVT